MVGKAPTIRWLLVIFLLASRGTLKSTCCAQRLLLAYGPRGDTARNGRQLTYSDEDTLVLDINVSDGEFVGERHGV